MGCDAAGGRWFPEAVSQAGGLPRRAARTLGSGGLTGLFRDKPGQAGCAVIALTTSETAIDDDAKAVYGKAGFRNAGGENNLAHASFSGANRSEEHTTELQSLMSISEAVFCWKTKTQ